MTEISKGPNVWGQVADDYHRFRQRYPDATIDTITREADLRPGDRILEFGAGTGILTQMLIAKGLRVTAVEPDAELRRVATRMLQEDANGNNAEIIGYTAMDAIHSGELARVYDGIIMGTSRKWIDDRGGLFRGEARELLRPATQERPAASIIAVRNTDVRDNDGGIISDETLDIRSKYMSAMKLPLAEDIEVETFGDGFQQTYFEAPVTTEQLSADQYLGRLATFGPVTMLEPEMRMLLLQELKGRIDRPPFNGFVIVSSATPLDIARRIDQ